MEDCGENQCSVNSAPAGYSSGLIMPPGSNTLVEFHVKNANEALRFLNQQETFVYSATRLELSVSLVRPR